MPINHLELRKKWSDFWKKRNHEEIPSTTLIPLDDPTTLFTSAGMQPLIPYLTGQTHPQGKRLFNIQPSFRSQDIEEIGDNRHTTFFEMMGNWSLGDYFKDEQLTWILQFLTENLGISKEKLHVTVFKGNKQVPKDTVSIETWKSLGIDQSRIYEYDVFKNWWSRSGPPEKMPIGEIGGPDSEIFYDFGTAHDPKFGEKCHPNCDCGRFIEIGNSVFIQYQKAVDGSLIELPQKNVDFGGGLERIMAVVNNQPDIFKTGLYWPMIEILESASGKKYEDESTKKSMRIISDHIKAAVFMANEGLTPGNKQQGYVMRRLIRRAVIKMNMIGINANKVLPKLVQSIISIYETVYLAKTKWSNIYPIIGSEIDTFEKSLTRGFKEINKISKVDGKIAFNLYQTYGFPLEITEEIFREKGQLIDKQEFSAEFEKHKNLSRTASSGMFKGGLADQSDQVIRYHTATHLLHQALFDVLKSDVRQEGSNITGERLRFDFHSTAKPSDQNIKLIEDIVNKKISTGLAVRYEEMPKDKAIQIGAKAFFKQKYPDIVKVYFIENYSKELCGGPHVKNTAEIKQISIYKFEKIGSDLYRIYAK